MSHFDVEYNQFQISFKYIKDNIVQDSIYSVESFDDSLLVLINNSIIDLDSKKALKERAKISELESYLSMYDNLEIENVYQESIDKLKMKCMRFRKLLQNLK